MQETFLSAQTAPPYSASQRKASVREEERDLNSWTQKQNQSNVTEINQFIHKQYVKITANNFCIKLIVLYIVRKLKLSCKSPNMFILITPCDI